jgi:hypothetical protein
LQQFYYKSCFEKIVVEWEAGITLCGKQNDDVKKGFPGCSCTKNFMGWTSLKEWCPLDSKFRVSENLGDSKAQNSLALKGYSQRRLTDEKSFFASDM